MKPNRWHQAARVRERQRALERVATQILKSAGRPRRKVAPNKRSLAPSPTMPRQLQLEDCRRCVGKD